MLLTLFLFFETSRGSAERQTRPEEPSYGERLDRARKLACESAILVKDELEASEPIDGLLAAYQAARSAFDDATGPAKNRAKILAFGARDALALARNTLDEASKKLSDSPHLLPEAILTEIVHLSKTAPPPEERFDDVEVDAAEAEMRAVLESASQALQAWSESQGSLEPSMTANKVVKQTLLRYVKAEKALEAAQTVARQKLVDGWELV